MGIVWPTLEHEQRLWEAGYQVVGGADEVGRGALVLDCVVAVVVLPRRDDLPEVLKGVRDSKTLSPRQRAALVPRIREVALACSLGSVSADEIDRLGMTLALQEAFMRAVRACDPVPDALILDAVRLPLSVHQVSFPKADATSLTVAAASVIAKEHRDALMREYAERYPGYGFERNAGYGTPEHYEAIRKLGLTPEHRRSFLGDMKREPTLEERYAAFPDLTALPGSTLVDEVRTRSVPGMPRNTVPPAEDPDATPVAPDEDLRI